jgi:hypothetical protein
MTTEEREVQMCRLWMLAIAILHWFVFYLLTQSSSPHAVNPDPVPSALAGLIRASRALLSL